MTNTVYYSQQEMRVLIASHLCQHMVLSLFNFNYAEGCMLICDCDFHLHLHEY